MKLQVNTFLLKLQLLTLTGIVLTQVLGWASVSSMLFTLTFFLTVGLWLSGAEKRLGGIHILALLIILISCINVALNALATNTVVSFSYIKKLIMFCSTVLFFAAMCEYRPERDVVDLVFRLNAVMAAFLVCMFFVQRQQMYVYKNQVTDYLTFRFTNPNLTAVFLSALCILEMLHVFAAERRSESFFHACLAVWMACFVYGTRARNAQLLLAFFLTACLLFVLFPNRRPRMPGWVAALIATFPLMFAAGYMLCISMPVVQERFAFLIGEGKNLDSRVEIWNFALEAISSSPMTGAYSQISGGTGSSQLHNSHLDVMASYGGFVLLLLCLFLAKVLYGMGGNQESRMGFLCRLGFGALLLSGLGEAMIFSGGLGIYIFFGVVRMLANYAFTHRE